MKKVGLTTTIPVEVLYAAGVSPVDLNNIFISAEKPMELVEQSEMAGYPRNVCGWIKGLYACTLNEKIPEVIAVTQGDCTNTHALMETLQMRGVKIIPFAYPYDRDRKFLKSEIEKLMSYYDVEWTEVNKTMQKLTEIRSLVWEIDRLTWEENKVGGFHNHLFQVSCSDFEGDPLQFKKKVSDFLEVAKNKKPLQENVRLGFIGVPPIITDLYDYLENIGARVVYNEIQRQFTMPFDTDDIVEQYLLYTYPYHAFARLEDIKKEIAKREIAGLIHYTQSFCFRQIEDIIYREQIDIPILTIEGDNPGKLDARTKMRIDTFVEMLA
ncbi:MAG: hypothetical protein PWQ96_187 [Clostridia bacterium]|jgi:benzoyl-CoA reductase/2-hydroxyglutaryl-CoA dehydratase subunit BcrC/BadD/HgdB|nr:Benzoyl-CoA reductase/2-hydroxyglutaryl-CoA dehydratase subunit, BcrC/BadD/HgdB [Clostridiales bacterium]MDK2984545.1 hypothetical protein [Clostridia bacterium]